MGRSSVLPTKEQALPGRPQRMPVPAKHFVNGAPLEGPVAQGLQEAVFGLGCFWGAEKSFWHDARRGEHRGRLRRRAHPEPDLP